MKNHKLPEFICRTSLVFFTSFQMRNSDIVADAMPAHLLQILLQYLGTYILIRYDL